MDSEDDSGYRRHGDTDSSGKEWRDPRQPEGAAPAPPAVEDDGWSWADEEEPAGPAPAPPAVEDDEWSWADEVEPAGPAPAPPAVENPNSDACGTESETDGSDAGSLLTDNTDKGTGPFMPPSEDAFPNAPAGANKPDGYNEYTRSLARIEAWVGAMAHDPDEHVMRE